MDYIIPGSLDGVYTTVTDATDFYLALDATIFDSLFSFIRRQRTCSVVSVLYLWIEKNIGRECGWHLAVNKSMYIFHLHLAIKKL